VTGGLGGIGCAVAGWLAERGAGVIVLNGRRPPESDVAEAIEVLRRRGSTVHVELADVTDAGAMDAMLERMDAELPPLGGVIHSVGVLSDAAIGNQSWETFETVLWPKLLGAWHLHRATVDRDLDMFVLFSSVAGVLGNPGQSNHAAANAFLDQLAAHRRALGLPGQAIAWGAWSEIGEAEEQRERMTQRSATSGIEWITPQQGLRSFDRLVREDAATGVVLARDWVAFGESLEVRPPFLEEVLADDAEDGTQSSSEDLLSRLRDAPAGTREEELVSYLQGEVQAVLRLPAAPQSTVGFFDLGMDSLMAVELRNRLNRALAGAYTVSNTAVFDYPNIAVLATHLTEELVGVVGASTPAVQPGPSHPPTTPGAPGGEADAVAIVGMACRFPGARNLPAFWDLLAAGTDALRDERREARPWSDFLDLLPDQYSAYCRGGFVEGIDQFDAKFFGISPIEARLIDPQQRMLLETGWQAFEDAGINPDRLSGSRTGVYVGVATSEYRDLMKNGDYGIGYLSTAASMAVGRLAFYFGLAGPTMPVELNCASSLVAVHQAVDGLRLREADLALAGGVSAVLSAPITREMADLGLLSREGSCKTFDAAADGFVRGEGCGMVVLKRLADAEADGDRIWAVIRGTAVNQNGASAGPTVPNGSAQERVISQALSQAGIAPSDVDYLEAHGAGSAFGDPIEVQAAAAVYGQERPDENPLLIGSVKTNIGHLESAAGIAGLMKTVLAMSRKVVPQHLNFDKPSPLVEWDRLPVQVASATAAWPAVSGRPPRAGVSAFGIYGVNAHVVLEGHEGADGGEDEDECLPEGAARRVPASLPQTLAAAAQGDDEFTARDARLLPLSAKSGGALQALAGEYLAWLDERTDLLSTDGDASGPLLSDMAWTAGVGRSHLDVRAGVVFRDTASLRERLQALAKAESNRGNSAGVKLAFVYADEIGSWAGVSKALYESEPVVRAVLDRCETVLRDERGGSLLEAMFERGGPADALNHSELGDPAAYALACALTALWSSIGIRPSVVGGRGAGEIAAAQAAGVFDLEDGLRIASIRSSRRQELQNGAGGGTGPGEQDATLDQISFEPPSIGLLSSATGQPVEPGKTLDAAYWRVQMQESSPSEHWADALAKLEVRVVVEIGAQAAQGSASENGAAAPVLLSSLRPTRSDGTSLATVCDTGFVDAAARAYEAGLPVSFEGLFAGEERRRVSLPGYPFQRLAHWLQKQQT
ncbi:MAG: SDR family NAD(P)-dependent oxidoreductase, partial [Rhodospirillales bacterium]|nr:SDR family NAD(P)-dependent oxidoreductase [Rhodospirillales bacterium]